jgi:hypothetical protein
MPSDLRESDRWKLVPGLRARHAAAGGSAMRITKDSVRGPRVAHAVELSDDRPGASPVSGLVCADPRIRRPLTGTVPASRR